jgi:hypothetical protein
VTLSLSGAGVELRANSAGVTSLPVTAASTESPFFHPKASRSLQGSNVNHWSSATAWQHLAGCKPFEGSVSFDVRRVPGSEQRPPRRAKVICVRPNARFRLGVTDDQSRLSCKVHSESGLAQRMVSVSGNSPY